MRRAETIGELLGKGHTPSVDDQDIRAALDLYNQLEAGIQVPMREVDAGHYMLMTGIKASLNEEQQRQAEQNTAAQGGVGRYG